MSVEQTTIDFSLFSTYLWLLDSWARDFTGVQSLRYSLNPFMYSVVTLYPLFTGTYN